MTARFRELSLLRHRPATVPTGPPSGGTSWRASGAVGLPVLGMVPLVQSFIPIRGFSETSHGGLSPFDLEPDDNHN